MLWRAFEIVKVLPVPTIRSLSRVLKSQLKEVMEPVAAAICLITQIVVAHTQVLKMLAQCCLKPTQSRQQLRGHLPMSQQQWTILIRRAPRQEWTITADIKYRSKISLHDPWAAIQALIPMRQLSQQMWNQQVLRLVYPLACQQELTKHRHQTLEKLIQTPKTNSKLIAM